MHYWSVLERDLKPGCLTSLRFFFIEVNSDCKRLHGRYRMTVFGVAYRVAVAWQMASSGEIVTLHDIVGLLESFAKKHGRGFNSVSDMILFDTYLKVTWYYLKVT